jgi:hypothetical protein
MSDMPKYSVPHVLTDTKNTYLGTNQRIIEAIDQHNSYEFGGKKLTAHIGTPGALLPDSRYIENQALNSARKYAEIWTKKIAEAGGGDVPKETKEAYASAMSSLRNVHHEILPKLPLDADLHARKDIE